MTAECSGTAMPSKFMATEPPSVTLCGNRIFADVIS